MQFIFDEQLGAFIVEEPTITIDFLKAKGWEYESPMTYYIDLEVKSSCRIIEFHYKDTRQMNINIRYTKFTKRLSNRFKEYTNSNYKYIYSEDDETIFYDLETFDEDLIAIKKKWLENYTKCYLNKMKYAKIQKSLMSYANYMMRKKYKKILETIM